MTISWELTVTPINIATHEASISATRTDTVTGSVATYTEPKARIETTTERLIVAQGILAKRQADINKKSAVAAFVTATESVGKDYLETNDVG